MARGGWSAAIAVIDLPARDLFEGDREVVLRPGVDHRRRELLEGALAEVVVVGVDLARALGGDGHAGVRGVDVLEQPVYAGGDHRLDPSAGRTTSSRAATASSSRSLTTTWRNS